MAAFVSALACYSVSEHSLLFCVCVCHEAMGAVQLPSPHSCAQALYASGNCCYGVVGRSVIMLLVAKGTVDRISPNISRTFYT